MTTPLPGQTPFSIPEALQLAQTHWSAGQIDQAEMLCQRVLAAWPGQTDALHMLGLMAHGFGNLDLAISHLRRACQAPRAPAVYFSNLAEMLRQQGGLLEAEQAARRATVLNNGLPGAWNNLGIILQERGKLEESRVCLERLLALEPNNAEGHNNLANTCKRAGKLDEAARHWARALELNPEYAEPYSNLSNWLNEQGEHERAAQHARRAIALNPRMVDAYINLAAAETSRECYDEALKWLNALLAMAPMNTAALKALALVQQHMDQLDAALGTAEAAVASDPTNADLLVLLGSVLRDLGRSQDAMATFDRAIEPQGKALERALVHRGLLLMELGRQSEAREAFDQVMSHFPGSILGFFNSADLRRFQRDDTSIAAMLALLRHDAAPSPPERMMLHFALGKAFLDIDESDLAFQHLNEGNRIKRQSITYNAEETRSSAEKIARIFSSDFMRRHAGGGAPSRMPVFVLGMPRSGTTLIEQILASHPAVTGAGELKHIRQLVESLGDLSSPSSTPTPERLHVLGAEYLRRIESLARGKRHVVDKMPGNFLHAGMIHLMLPQSRIIHCRRDPVDTCLSCYSKLFTNPQSFSYDMRELGLFYRCYQQLMQHWREVLPASQFLEVDYEAVIDDLEAQTRRILGFLDLPWDPACLTFYRTERMVKTASLNQVREPIYRTSSGRWRKHAANLAPLLEALQISP